MEELADDDKTDDTQDKPSTTDDNAPNASDYSFAFSPFVLGIAVAFLAFVGVVFGSYPANKASCMRPIDALRFA